MYLSNMENKTHILSIAIDFGTTYSGYAFSFKTDPNDIKMNKNWGGNIGFQSYKTPTSVLLDSDCNLQAFGYEAEEHYGNLDDTEQSPDNCAMFQKFKMALHGRKVIYF